MTRDDDADRPTPRLRVLMVTPGYLPEIGGVEIHVANVATRLAAQGVDVSVLCGTHDPALVGRSDVDGVEVIRVRARVGWTRWAPEIHTEMQAGRWDIVHVQSYHTFVAPIAMRAARRLGIPYVVTFHGGGSSSTWLNRIRSTQIRSLGPLLRSADRLVAVARFEVAHYGELLGIGADRFRVVPNGADLPTPPDTDTDNTDNADADAQMLDRIPGAGASIRTTGPIVSIGRLERYKGHHRVIAAMPSILQSRPDARLIVLGAGPFGDDLDRQVRELHVGHAVTIRSIPAERRDDMAQLLGSASLVTLLSDFETHPIGALEAISLGRQLLVTHGSGLSELVERSQAVGITDIDDPAGVARAILDLLRHPRPPQNTAIPTWDECAAGLLDVYRTTLTGDPSDEDLDAESVLSAPDRR